MWHGSGVRNKFYAVIFIYWYFLDKYSIVYDFLCYIYSLLFGRFLLLRILLFVIDNIAVSTFPGVIYFVLIGTWNLPPGYIVAVFLQVSHLVAVLIFWYFWRYVQKLSMKTVFLLVPIFTASCSVTLALGFYVKYSSYYLELFIYDRMFIWWFFDKSMSWILLIVIL